MRCCEVRKPIENCFDPISFECVDFQKLSQIIANFTREILAEREAEITNLPWTQSEKHNALPRCRIGQRARRTNIKTCFVSELSLVKRATPWKTMMDQVEAEFHMARTGAGGLGSQFLFNAYRSLLERGTVPEHFAQSRTVFIPWTSDIDYNGRIIRSPDALRSLTLCNCDCKLLNSAFCRGLHWYTMRCIHLSQRCISSRPMIDTALVHVACSPQESGIPLKDFAAAYLTVNHTWILSVIEKTGLLDFISRFLRNTSSDSITNVELEGTIRGQSFVDGRKTGLSSKWFSFCNGLRSFLQMSPRDNYPKEP